MPLLSKASQGREHDAAIVGKQILIVEDEQVFRSLLDSGFPHWERQRYWRLMGWMPLSAGRFHSRPDDM